MNGGVRQRSAPAKPSVAEVTDDAACGKTPAGRLFKIPQTHDMLSSLFDPRLPKSHIDILTLALLGIQVVLFAFLPLNVSRYFFLVYFAGWRLAYNVGLGYVLRRQSEERWIVETVIRKGWMDGEKRPQVKGWIQQELRRKMGQDYAFEEVPLEYNVWIMFRHFVDVILLNDFLSYCFFALSFLQFPPGHSLYFHVLRWVGGWTLVLFNLWVKVDAHRIVKDYAWYWGDAFFTSMQDLVFDGVFELAPHPMYSVGYAGYYGLSLIVASETVLLVSLAAHACQFGFLVYFENPHIERTYGSRKPLAARVPLSTFAATSSPTVGVHKRSGSGVPSLATSSTHVESDGPERSAALTRHDLDNRYFGKDLLVLRNFDVFRSRDLAFVLVVFYSIWSFALPSFSPSTQLTLAFINALVWRLAHTCGLGLALKAQSETKWIVRHFLKHYHYENSGGAVADAFENWKATYNLSLCMSYVSFGALAWRCYTIPVDWTVGTQVVRHALGLLLLFLHVWTALSTFEVLGPFGWFYGDFFIQDYPAELYYTGIYRFLNNPERSMGGAAFFGIVLICGSKLLLVQAVIAILSHWWFLSVVENAHMKRLYGKAIRQDAGVTKTLKNVASRNTRVFGGLTRSVKEVHGTFGKVLEGTADAVEDFLTRSTPKIQSYVDDTKILLKQSGERLVFSRTANDLTRYDQRKYSLAVAPSQHHPLVPHASGSAALPRFHLGEAITVEWHAPANHSRRDWIGIYRLGANKSQLVTRVSSQGRWCGVKPGEWKGDSYNCPIEHEQLSQSESGGDVGAVVLSGNKLPWTVGTYEIRYHHDGKHNVMASPTLVEIYLEKGPQSSDIRDIQTTLTAIVAQVLGFDPALIPASAQHLIPTESLRRASLTQNDDVLAPQAILSDPDDFVIYSQNDAQHIAYAIDEVFDVELTSEVVIAAANVAKLAYTISESRRLLKPNEGGAIVSGEPKAMASDSMSNA